MCRLCKYHCPKCYELIVKAKKKLCFGPLIRYTYLNALKMNQVALLAIMNGRKDQDSGQLAFGIALWASFSIVIPGIYIGCLVRNLDNLDKPDVKEMFGTLYQ